MTLSGNEYNVIYFNDLRAGEMISIPVKKFLIIQVIYIQELDHF